MSHPIFHDVPDRDMSKALERQADLDAKVQAFLANGGKIKAFDTMRRPVERSEWRNFTLNASPPPLEAVPAVPAKPKPKPQKPNQIDPAPKLTADEPVKPACTGVVVGRVPVPSAMDVDSELKQLLRQAAALKRDVEQLEQRVKL